MKLEDVTNKATELLRQKGGGSLFATSDGQLFKGQSFAHSHSFNLKDKKKFIISTEPHEVFDRLIFEGSDWNYINISLKEIEAKELNLEELTVKELKAMADEMGLTVKGTKKEIIQSIKNHK